PHPHLHSFPTRRSSDLALIAALLFGLSTPAAKILLDTTDPWLLAGLFYLGSGLGLGGLRVILLLIGRAPRDAPLRRRDVPWLTRSEEHTSELQSRGHLV